jgi:hypothetical protein
VDNDPNYNSYRKSRKIRPEVDSVLEATCVDLTRGGGIQELESFQQYFHDRYKIVVYNDLKCNSIMYEGQVNAPKRINLLYNDVEKHYHVINNLTGALAKQYLCEACNECCKSDVTHLCDKISSNCYQSSPSIVADTRVSCNECNRHFRSRKCLLIIRCSLEARKNLFARGSKSVTRVMN